MNRYRDHATPVWECSRNRAELLAICDDLGVSPHVTTRAELMAMTLTAKRPAQCPRGHDMLDPLNVQVYVGADASTRRGWRIWYRCRTCKREDSKRRAHYKKQTPNCKCQQCGQPVFNRGHSQFCSVGCRKVWLANCGRSTPQRDVHALSPGQLEHLLQLQADLERETRAWLRPEIQARIDAITKPRK